MSKFKVGDRVVFKQEGWRGRIVEIKDDGIHVVMFDDGSGDWFREDQLARNSALHSANPVVQNALNRKACNGSVSQMLDAFARQLESNINHGAVRDGMVRLVRAVESSELSADDKSRIKAMASDAVDAYSRNDWESKYKTQYVDAARKLASRFVANAVSVEIKRKRSGVKTVVPIDEFKKSTQYGRDLTGYERFMLGRGIDKMETDEYRYSVVVTNAAYSKALKAIMDSVKPLLDKRIKGDMSWNGPLQVITALRKTCDSATMSAGRYDHQRPRHRVYDVECTRDGLKFHGNLVCTGLLHRDDPDDVSTFDEYDMTLALAYAGRALNASRSDAVLADYKKFVKAQMAAVLLALEKAKRDISAQGETSAKTAKATSSTDEHEIIRDYSGKTAKAIDEAISKLKSAKENPLIL